ncbi:MAG TPA: NADH-quinone oxidoreductase subunit J [Candidatus Baltobacteraceae bacterium]
MITFWILAVLIVASAVFVVSASRPVYSVLGLLLNFLLLAMMYLTLDAEFLAVIQVVVYSGAILMLFLFVIALLSSGVRQFSVGPNRLPRILAPLSVFGALALGGLLFVIVQSVTPSLPQSTAASAAGNANVFGSVADFGQALFTTYLLPFEATAFVLMIAVIGVIALAGDVDPPRPPRRKPLRKREPILKERS